MIVLAFQTAVRSLVTLFPLIAAMPFWMETILLQSANSDTSPAHAAMQHWTLRFNAFHLLYSSRRMLLAEIPRFVCFSLRVLYGKIHAEKGKRQGFRVTSGKGRRQKLTEDEGGRPGDVKMAEGNC